MPSAAEGRTKMQDFFLTSDEKSKEAYKNLISQAADAIASVFCDDSAYSGPTPNELREIVRQSSILPESGLGWERTFSLMRERILPNLLRTSSVNYMAHLHGPSLLESVVSELVISTFNQSMDSWDQSPVATEIEEDVVRHLCSLFGYGDGSDGVFTSGGSQSNMTALILARDWFCKNALKHDVKKSGLNEDCSRLRMYTSEISHFSMEKSAHVLGLGYQSVVKVPVDSKKRMDAQALRSLVEADRKAGKIPFLVVGTVGTTDFGSIDPLDSLAQVARENEMWLHADAAYGAGVVMSDKYSGCLKNLSLCDSITVDFHKMFLMTISCGALLVRRSEDFDALTIHADYLNREEDEEDGYINLVDKSLQTTRRFDALKVWTSFQMRGKDGWSRIIETSMDNARYFHGILSADSSFEVLCEPEISSVVFRYNACDEVNKRVRRALIHSHGVVIGQTVSDGKVFLKFTLLNPLITHAKLDELKALIKTLSENAR